MSKAAEGTYKMSSENCLWNLVSWFEGTIRVKARLQEVKE